MMGFKPGDRVARVSLASDADPGRIGDAGTIDRRFIHEGHVFGYCVVWDTRPKESQYVAPQRVAELATYQRDEQMKAHAR